MMTGHLFRYTELPYLLHMLMKKEITLLTYRSWEDQNDIHYLDEFSAQRNVSTSALCFTEATETFHHWKLFSKSSSGVRITFDKAEVAEWVDQVPGMQMQDVAYKTIREIREKRPNIDLWPFVKRYPYQDEREVRLIYEDSITKDPFKNFGFDLGMIKRITLGPWLHKSIRVAVIQAIHNAAGNDLIQVSRTTLISNDEWKRVTLEESR